MKTEPNQPVYPHSSPEAMEQRPSLTIRQAFAMAAMQGLLATDAFFAQEAAEAAVQCADALIAELNKEA